MICFVPQCSHYTEHHTCKLFRFPKDAKERSKWIKAIRREDKQPTDSSRVCSCHFRDGNKLHGPSIFPWNEKKVFTFESPIKKRSRKLPAQEQETSVAEVEVEPFPVEEEGVTKSTQTISSIQSEAEITVMKSQISQLHTQIECLKKTPFSFLCISSDEFLINYYTGVSKQAFLIISELCSNIEFKYVYRWKPSSLSLNDQLLITLMKLRLNLGYVDLGVRFNTSKHTIGNIVLTFVHLLHEILFENGMKDIPSQSKNILSLPHCFSNYRNCRIVLDCTEFRCEIPKKIDEQRNTFSSYKHYNTLKGLIGVAPNGTITYASKLYPGSASDKAIVKECGILEIFKPGDLILADKGFLLDDIVPNYVSVNIPPFLYSSQFTPSEVEETQNIARARIHVERAIRRLKLYHVLHLIPRTLYKHSTKIFQLCAALTNYKNPLISEVSSSYNSLHSNITVSGDHHSDMEWFSDE